VIDFKIQRTKDRWHGNFLMKAEIDSIPDAAENLYARWHADMAWHAARPTATRQGRPLLPLLDDSAS